MYPVFYLFKILRMINLIQVGSEYKVKCKRNLDNLDNYCIPSCPSVNTVTFCIHMYTHI